MLAGVEYSVNIFTTVNVTVHAATATSDPVAVAEFFSHVGNATLDGLFATKLIGSAFSVSWQPLESFCCCRDERSKKAVSPRIGMGDRKI
jgi:hypothetical protein